MPKYHLTSSFPVAALASGRHTGGSILAGTGARGVGSAAGRGVGVAEVREGKSSSSSTNLGSGSRGCIHSIEILPLLFWWSSVVVSETHGLSVVVSETHEGTLNSKFHFKAATCVHGGKRLMAWR